MRIEFSSSPNPAKILVQSAFAVKFQTPTVFSDLADVRGWGGSSADLAELGAPDAAEILASRSRGELTDAVSEAIDVGYANLVGHLGAPGRWPYMVHQKIAKAMVVQTEIMARHVLGPDGWTASATVVAADRDGFRGVNLTGRLDGIIAIRWSISVHTTLPPDEPIRTRH